MCYNGGNATANQCKCEAEWNGKFCEIRELLEYCLGSRYNACVSENVPAKCREKGISPESMLSAVDMVFMIELTYQAHAQVRRQ